MPPRSRKRLDKNGENSRQSSLSHKISHEETSTYEFLNEQESNTSASSDESDHITISRKSMLYINLYSFYLVICLLYYLLGKSKDKKNDTKKSKRDGSKATNMDVSVNMYSENTHLSDNDNDLSSIVVPVTPPSLGENVNEVCSHKFITL